MSSGPSPSKEWKKPSQVMKVRLKRQRKSTSDLNTKISTSPHVSQTQPGHGDRLAASGSGRSGKRRNPFGSGGSNVMRRRVQSQVVGNQSCSEEKENGSHHANHQKLFSALDSKDEDVFCEDACQRMVAAMKEIESQEESKSQAKQVCASASKLPADQLFCERLPCGKPSLPADWCLRTRLRFTSRTSFGWSQPMRMMDEARGLSSFVQGSRDSESKEEAVNESSWRTQLQQSTMCWMHPHLPWLNLFPRIVSEPKTFKQSVATKDPAIANALMASWSESFRSVFHLLRSSHCPYFYLCTHQFTVLFRAAGLAGKTSIHALLSPTTRGLREALKNDGIEFSMPLNDVTQPQADAMATSGKDKELSRADDGVLPNRSSDEALATTASEGADVNVKAEGRTDVGSGDIGEEQEEEEEEEESNAYQSPTKASSWLQSMGLNKANFPSLEPSRVKFQTDHLLKLDNRPQSLVLVEGPDTQALFNFLLNSRSVVASVGPLADIPPTILSPVAFKGATLHSCKVKAGTMKQQQQTAGLALQEVSTLEVTGPIMPHNIHDLCTLLRTTQEGAFHVAFSNHEATAAFTASSNVLSGDSLDAESKSADTLQKLRMNCKLADSLLEHLSMQCSLPVAAKEVTVMDGLYS
ncbi:protein downstream neighbor of Son-like [Diadema setosum]|uniref:protein downstream neighbor of Son-like n=1 Tax=Diadema setosum TaxID=31175 RepID=UPI003B3B7C4A